MFKVNDIKKNRKRWEIFSKLTINTRERRQRRRSGVFIVNFEHVSLIFLLFLFVLFLFCFYSGVFIVTNFAAYELHVFICNFMHALDRYCSVLLLPLTLNYALGLRCLPAAYYLS